MHWLVCSGETVADEYRRRRGGKDGMKTRKKVGQNGRRKRRAKIGERREIDDVNTIFVSQPTVSFVSTILNVAVFTHFN